MCQGTGRSRGRVLLLSSRYVKLYFFRPFSKSVTYVSQVRVGGVGASRYVKRYFLARFLKRYLCVRYGQEVRGKQYSRYVKRYFLAHFLERYFCLPDTGSRSRESVTLVLTIRKALKRYLCVSGTGRRSRESGWRSCSSR